MPLENFPNETKKFEIQPYKKPRDITELYRTHAAFCGSPMKHPHDRRKLIVVSDPAGTSPFYYEFFINDIECMEEMPHLTDPQGEVFNMARVWVKKGCLGMRCIPFVVDQISDR